MNFQFCSNCATPLKGRYCYECGQPEFHRKYSLSGLLTEMFASGVHVSRQGLAHTIKELTLRPGPALHKVLNGKRLYLYPPFKYLILAGAAVIIFSHRYKFFETDFTNLEEQTFPLLYLTTESRNYLQDFFRFAEDEATLLNVVAIPVFTFFTWAFLSRGKYNLAENLIINTFITAHQLLFLLLLVPFLELMPQSKVISIQIYSLLAIVYNTWVYIHFFPGKKIWLTLKSMLVVLLCYVYQFPVNLGIYFIYNEYLRGVLKWFRASI